MAPAMRSMPGRRARERAVRRLRHGDPRVRALLQQVHQPQAVLRAAARCRRRGSARSRGRGRRGRAGPAPAGTSATPSGVADLLVAAAHQADVAVEVHRLVRLVRQRRRTACARSWSPRRERRRPAGGGAAASRSGRQDDALVGAARRAPRRSCRGRRPARPSTWSTKKTSVWSTISLPVGQVVQPVDGEPVVRRPASRMSSVVGARRRRRRRPRSKASSAVGTRAHGHGQLGLDLRRAGPGRRPAGRGPRRVVGFGGSSMSSTTRRYGYSCSAADSSVVRTTRSSSWYDGHEHRHRRRRAGRRRSSSTTRGARRWARLR